MTLIELEGVDAVRADGGLVHIRSAQSTDHVALRALHANSSDRAIYLRFFSANRYAADAYLDVLLRPDSPQHRVLVGIVGGEIVAVAGFEAVDAVSAEVALLVDDAHQGEGIGTLLLEHLASGARHLGFTRFVADVLAVNYGMIRVFRDLGFAVTSHSEKEVQRIEVDLDPRPDVLAASDVREQAADAASLQPLLAPRSIAIIGAGSRPMSVGHQVLRNVLDGGFTGATYVVNPRHDAVLGVPSVPSALDLPVAPDLAIIAVRAPQLLQVLRDCGQRDARGALILTAGLGETGPAGQAMQDEAVLIARRYGMRLIGPNCLGILNTDNEVRLNATFAPFPMAEGGLGLASQSGALGIAVVKAAERTGLGLSQFVSMGNKADVSGNDLLLAWEHDPRTTVIALYLESFGNARRFAHIARRVSRRKPIIAIKAGRSAAGQRAGLSHTAAAASSDAVVDALFTQAGVIRVDTMTQMIDLAQVLSGQPVPSGPRLAIVGNSGGPEILAVDAASAAGLTMAILDERTIALLRKAAPSAASRQNPVDLGASAQPQEVAAALAVLLAADEVDCVLAVFTETLVASIDEVMRTIASAATMGVVRKPVVATHVGGEPRSLAAAGTEYRVPVFGFPEPAAAALAGAWRYAQIRSRKPFASAPAFDDDVAGAQMLVRLLLTDRAGWLGPEETARLLLHYRVPLCPQRVVTTVEDALSAARELGYPVAVKLAGVTVHKSDVQGVRLGLREDSEVRAAFTQMMTTVPAATGALIQPMVGRGTEMILGAVQDAQFGPVVMIGAGGILADLVADRAFSLAPVSPAEAAELIGSLRMARLLDGYRGLPAVSRPALSALLAQLSRLVEDLPEVAEIDLNPVICCGDDLLVVDAKIRLEAASPGPDPTLRQLRAASHAKQ